MARKTNARVLLNRAGLTAFGLQLAGGVANVCESIITRAHVPDDPPYGKGLIETGGWVVYFDGHKIAGPSAKPHHADAGQGITGFAGWGSPIAHLLEYGTVKMRAEPFLMPATLEAENGLEALMREGVKNGLHP